MVENNNDGVRIWNTKIFNEMKEPFLFIILKLPETFLMRENVTFYS